MLSVLVVNDSTRAALKKSQRVIAKYLPQVGPATYMGSLSAEGLRDLERELIAMRSRYMSVGCYKVAHDLSPDLQWVVGSKTHFDEEHSLYAHRSRTLAPKIPYVEGTPTAKLLALTLRLAALTHDIGKMSDAFQQKLWRACSRSPGGPRGEFIRHDAMSYRVIRGLGWSYAALSDLPSLSPSALSERVSAPSAEHLRDSFDADLKADLTVLRQVLAPAGARARKPVPPVPLEELVLRVGAFLSLTHHRLPGPGRPAHRGDLTYLLSLSGQTYFNPAESARFVDCLQFSGGNIFESDLDLGAALRKVLTDLRDVTAALQEDFDQNAFLRLALAYARPVLVLSDYLASGLKSGEPVAHGALLGNTIRSSDPAKPAVPGDSLATHVRSVYHHARRQAQFALNLSANSLVPMPELSRSAQRAIDAKRRPAGKFAWQAELHAHIKSHTTEQPSFVAVTASTGSGKTIASAQIMRALGSNRWTYCLGLRSLTLQTGRSYQEDLSLTDADLAVVIGDQIARKAFEKEVADGAVTAGSESLAQQPEAVVSSTEQSQAWIESLIPGRRPGALRDVFGARKLNYVATPVVVCTIDQLIGVTRLSSVTKAFDYKRLQSADLVLDEVDNYSPSELKHLARLCFLVGLSRKNLVCLSATMGPLHIESLLYAYRDGLRLNHSLTGLGADLRFTTASDLCDPDSVSVTAGTDLTVALNHNEKFNLAARVLSLRLPPKAIPFLLDCEAGNHAAVLDGAIAMHRRNSTLVGNAQVSAGFIRMNTVSSARKLAKYLLETVNLPDDVELAVVCYHAKYAGLALSLIDRALNVVTNRKRLVAGQEFSKEAIEAYIAPILAGTGKQNLLIIAVTTSIIETGRDHDYDWAILEPSSHRSHIQAAGRVRRHRGAHTVPAGNVGFIAYPARACSTGEFKPANPIKVFSYPGPLTALADRRFFDVELSYHDMLTQACAELAGGKLLEADLARDSSAHGFLSEYAGGMRNTVSLTQPRDIQNSLAMLEQYVLYKALTEPEGLQDMSKRESSVSARAQQAKGLWLTSWAYQDDFRDDATAFLEDQVYLMHRSTLQSGKHQVVNPVTASGAVPAHVHRDKVELASPFRSLLTGAAGGIKSMEELLEEEAAALAEHGFSASDLLGFSCFAPERYATATPAKVSYSPLLGFENT